MQYGHSKNGTTAVKRQPASLERDTDPPQQTGGSGDNDVPIGWNMKSFKVVLTNEEGLHARPAMDFVDEAQRFKSAIHVLKDGQKASAKSFVGVMGLGGCQGDEIEVVAEGEDEEAAIGALHSVVAQFG